MAVVMNKGEGARRWFETMYGAGKGVAEGIESRAKKRAGKELVKAQNEAIPTYQESADALTSNYDGPGMPVEEFTAERFVGPQQNVKYGRDITAYRQRKNDALNEYAGYVEPDELIKIEEAYDTKNAKNYQRGMSKAAEMIAVKADPEAIAATLNNTYALNPTAITGMASVVGDEVVMSFFDEASGKVRGTVPMNDANALRKMAAAYDDPKFAAEFGLKERRVKAAEEDINIKRNALTERESANKAGFAAKILGLDATSQAAKAALDAKRAKRGDAANKRLDAIDKDITSFVDKNPMPPETNGSRVRQIAVASEFVGFNPRMTASQGVDARRKFDTLLMPKALAYMEAHPELKKQFEESGYELPAIAAAEAYDNLKRNKLIKVDKDNPSHHYFMDGKKQVLIPPLLSGEDGTTDYGYMYSIARDMGGSSTVGAGGPSSGLVATANQYGEQYLGGDPTRQAAPAAIPAPGPAQAPPAQAPPAQAPPPETGVKPFTEADKQNVISTLDLAIQQDTGDGAVLAAFMTRVEADYGRPVANQIAALVGPRIDAIKTGPNKPAAIPTNKKPGRGPSYAPEGTVPVPYSVVDELKGAYKNAQDKYNKTGVTPRAAAYGK